MAIKTLAYKHRLDFEQVFGENEFLPDPGISTRLGAQDRIVHFDIEDGPFSRPLKGLSIPLKELPIRHFLLPSGLSPDAEPDVMSSDSDCINFRLGEALFRYSRLGLEHIRNEASLTSGIPP